MASTFNFYRLQFQLEVWLGRLLLLCIALQAIALAIGSFQWRLGNDVGFFYYASMLVNEHSYLPYRDIHDTSFPGTYLIYALITGLTGYSSTGFLCVNLLLATLNGFLLYRILRPVHTHMGIAAGLIFVNYYFISDHSNWLQRDFFIACLATLSLAAATLLQHLRWRAMSVGLLMALACLVKPHAVLGAPLFTLLAACYQDKAFRWQTSRVLQCISLALVSFLLVLAITALLMAQAGLLTPFWRMATEYLPLYQRMNGVHQILDYPHMLRNGFDWASNALLLALMPFSAASLSLAVDQVNRASTMKFYAVIFLIYASYVIYIGLGGKFWDYHQIPANVFYACILAALFIPVQCNTAWKATLRLVCFLVGMFFTLGYNMLAVGIERMACLDFHSPVCTEDLGTEYRETETLVAFIRQHLRAGERIEPLATSTGGPIFPALLQTGVLPVTPYLEGFPLYHDAGIPYIQSIRQDAMTRLVATPPRFMIRSSGFFGPSGNGASRFMELENFRAAHYRLVGEETYPELAGITTFSVYEIKP
ncbi:MAG TPA: hypothetical protein PLF22_01225 [Pseudomonadales bacterium]|nr:hypothetical protein [Pseudomonadales bacterium]